MINTAYNLAGESMPADQRRGEAEVNRPS